MNNDSNNLRSNLSHEAKILKFSRLIEWFAVRERSKILLFSGLVRGLLVLKEQPLCWDTLTFSCFAVLENKSKYRVKKMLLFVATLIFMFVIIHLLVPIKSQISATMNQVTGKLCLLLVSKISKLFAVGQILTFIYYWMLTYKDSLGCYSCSTLQRLNKRFLIFVVVYLLQVRSVIEKIMVNNKGNSWKKEP